MKIAVRQTVLLGKFLFLFPQGEQQNPLPARLISEKCLFL
jgi:hypothetical protein